MLFALNPKSNLRTLYELANLLIRHRQLVVEMARREISERYAGQLFGVFWTIGHPLVLVLVYVFIFGFVFKIKVGGSTAMPLDYTTYLLSGLIPWLAFQDAMSKASTAISSNAPIVKQIVFPIEVLPVKGVLTSLLTETIFLCLLLIYVLISQNSLPWTYALLPLLMVLQALAMIGVSYILSATGVFLRDTKDFVQIFSVVGLYLMPAFYLPEAVPGVFRWFLYVNPFSYLTWCYQDALYFGRFEHPWAWLILFILCLGIFSLGYRYFRKLKILFGNFL